MTSATLSQFRAHQSELIASTQREPLVLTSRGAQRRAVVVSPEFFDRAVEALEGTLDADAAVAAREEGGPFALHRDLMRELGL